MSWQQKSASIVGSTSQTVTVWCPFEKGVQHTHPRQSAGSRDVVAHCHAGFTRCRSYAIPTIRNRGKNTHD